MFCSDDENKQSSFTTKEEKGDIAKLVLSAMTVFFVYFLQGEARLRNQERSIDSILGD